MARPVPKLYLLATVSAAALSLGAAYLARHRSLKAAAEGRLPPPRSCMCKGYENPG